MRSSPRRIRLLACVVALAGLGLVSAGAGVALAANGRSPALTSPSSVNAYVTYYGWYDNTPPGCATAYSGCAHGNGTYADPITFASYKGEFPVGTVVYYPTVEKYFKMGDSCQECQADWTGKGPDGGPHLYHVDLWIGGKGGNEFDVINCEDALTQGLPNGKPLLTPLVLNPGSGLPVSTEKLFNSKDNHCFGGAQTSASYGRYKNESSGKCIADETATSGAPVVEAPCSTSADEDLAFEGAFFTANKLCLQTKGSIGSALEWATCTGSPGQQWETGGPNGQIAWIQYLRCITDVGGTVKLEHCAPAADNEWIYTAESSTAG